MINMNTKNMTIAIVAILLVSGIAAAGMYLIAKDEGDDSPQVYSSLPIMGNANNDDRIDQNDIDLINGIIEGEESFEDYPYADANNDGKVTEIDKNIVQNIMDVKETEIFVVDQNNDVVELKFPLKNIVTVNPDMLTMMILIGCQNEVAGFIASEYEVEQRAAIDAGAVRLAKARALNADNWDAFIDLDQNLYSEGGIGAVLVMTEAAVSEKKADLDKAGIPVLSIKCSAPLDTLDASLLIGILTGNENQARTYYETSHQLLKEIDEKTKNLTNEEKTKVVSFNMTYYLTETESAYTKVTQLAGGNNITDIKGDTSGKLGTHEAITKYDAAKYFINFKTLDYVEVDVKDVWNSKNIEYLHAGDAYLKGNLVFLNVSMPVPCRVAYVAEILYPELFEEGYGDRILQEYVDAFLPHLSKNQDDGYFDVKTDMTTIITKADFDAVNT